MFALRLLGLLLLASTQASLAATQTIDVIQPKLELKFQTELDNSTVIKQLEQQQIFKCQVRLAPAGSGALSGARPRFKWSSRAADSREASGDELEFANWPRDERLNISRLSLEWLRDERPLLGDDSEPIGLINVTLRGQSQQQQFIAETGNQGAKQAKTKRPRIEIKNTLNGAQLKLTSRLRVARLKPADGGHYKCVARASFRQRPVGSPAPVQVDQWLESNATLLVVSSAGGAESGRRQESSAGRKKWTPTSDATTRPWQARGGALNSVLSGLAETKQSDMQAPTNQVDSLADTSTSRGANPSGWNLFEDDEDLFRPEPGELINGQPSGQAGAANEENNDNTSNQDLMIEFSDNGELSSDSSRQDVRALSAGLEQPDGYLDRILVQQQQQPSELLHEANRESAPPATWGADNDEPIAGRSRPTNTNDRLAAHHHSQVSSFLQPQLSPRARADPPFGSKQHLAKLVHKIAPDLSCYTGVGEFYHGSISFAVDQRPCLNWLHVRLALAANLKEKSSNRTGPSLDWGSLTTYAPRADNHNSCRNPNSDPRGPWCFAAYSEQLDGPLREPSAASAASQLSTSRLIKMITRKQRLVWLGAKGQSFVVRACAIGSCSEYLWLYVVAPPLGLFVLLTCLMSLLVRAVRKSHYNSIFSAAYQRHTENGGPARALSPGLIARGLGKVFRSRAKRRCFATGTKHAKATGCASKSNYLDDDIFEIVHDIDWSEGQAPSSANSISSPKSNESFKLNAASFVGHHHASKPSLTHSKSINPILSSDRATLTSKEPNSSPPPRAPPRLASSNMSKSKSQAGPMFATLRCHVRNTQLQQHKQQRLTADPNNSRSQHKKSSSFIDNADLPSSNSDWLNPSIGSNPSSLQNDSSQSSGVKTGRLISCSSSTSSSGTQLAGDRQEAGDKLVAASELPRLEPSSVNVSHESQPLFEGKFSQVQWAYLKQEDNDATQATGRIGAQVALHALKQQAAVDESAFVAANLRLRNLNHLNVIKVIGYVQYENNDALAPTACAIVYDMAHLMDLSDWLKEQAKEALSGQNEGPTDDLSLRQNLACIAKQVALAVDYLHDKQIVYKDLACRNCFLDATRMLVKLASFNVEPEFEESQSSGEYDVPQLEAKATSDPTRLVETSEAFKKKFNLKSMVRPKYLLDYYVIDSRPSECQLLPLSWIPLESILFNKFNRQTDIWSYGCLLYELFSLGEVAYFGYSSKQVIDAVRSNLMPPQPLLCPNGIYKLMCKCLSDIPTLRPNIKHIYEQLNLYSGQCSSFLNHHLCII